MGYSMEIPDSYTLPRLSAWRARRNFCRACLTSAVLSLPTFWSATCLYAIHQVSWEIQDACWTLRPVHLPFECHKHRLSLCTWLHYPRLDRPALPPPLLSAVLMRSFLLEHRQDHPVVCVHPCLPNPCVEKVLSDCAEDVVPPLHHLSVLPSRPPCPVPVSYVPPPCREVVCHVFQSAV